MPDELDISIWISIIALIVSVAALVFSFISNQSKIKISLAAQRNSIRVDVHEQLFRLVNLINEVIELPKTDQHVNILNKMVETSQGLHSVYDTLNESLYEPLDKRTEIAIRYCEIASDLQEFKRVLGEAQSSLERGKMDELETAVNGMYNRVFSTGKKSDLDRKE